LQDLAILNTCLEECGVERKTDTLLDSFVLNERINAKLLKLLKAARIAHLCHWTKRLHCHSWWLVK